MRKELFAFLAVVAIYSLFQPVYGALPQGVVWGPENQGLRMNLQIENVDGNQPNVYRVRMRLANAGATTVVLAAEETMGKHKGDYREFFKEEVTLTSFPECPQDSAQVGVEPGRSSSLPILDIKSGDSVAFEWVTAPRRLKPNGYYNTAPILLTDGLYSIRARFVATTKQGERVLLYSNDCQLAVGGKTSMPKFAMARITQSDAKAGTVVLDAGSDQKIELNDRFTCVYFPYARWEITITDVKPWFSTGSVKTTFREAHEKVPTFPEERWVVTLLTAEGHR